MKHICLTIFYLTWLVSQSLSAQSFSDFNNNDTIPPGPEFATITLKSSQVVQSSYYLYSPNGEIQIGVDVFSDYLKYNVIKSDYEIINQSVLNYVISEGYLTDGIQVTGVEQNSDEQTIDLLYGETTSVRNNYNELILHCSNEYGITFDIIFRTYDEGVAFRIYFTEENTSKIYVTNDQIQFVFADTYTAFCESSNENGYTEKSTSSTFTSLIPLTLTNTNNCLCINEAGNDNYARAKIKGLGSNTLQTTLISSNTSKTAPFYLPWRAVVIGDNVEDLYVNKDFMYGLTYTDDYDASQWDWVKPGKVFRCLDLTTDEAKDAIDLCVDYDIPYVLFDAGWYGLGYSYESSSSSDPMDVIDEMDMDEIRAYAEDKGVGIILYINKVAWNNYDNTEMLDLYQSWGIKGIKLGFMDGYSSSGNEKIYKIIKMAGERDIFVNVHDNFRPTEMFFKYQNLLTAEGIRGNEHTGNTGDHTTLLPFTRYLTGAADYTICYFGNDPDYNKPKSLGTSRAHQLALSVMFYSPLQHVFWYGKAGIYTIPVETELFKYLPTVWDDFKVVTSDMGEYVAIARKSDEKWFLSVITNSSARTVSLPLNFLDSSVNYEVTIFTDKETATINKEESTVDALKENGDIQNNSINLDLWANGGAVIVFKDDNTTDMEEAFSSNYGVIYPNPSSGVVNCQLGTVSEIIKVKVFSLQGVLLKTKDYEKVDNFSFDISDLPQGVYIIEVQSDDEFYTNKILLKK